MYTLLCFYVTCLLIWVCLFVFVLYPISIAVATNISAQVNNIPMLSWMNFKFWKDAMEIVFSCMGLDLTLRSEQPIPTPKNLGYG